MNTGTIVLNAAAGRTSRRTAPVMPPSTDIAPKRTIRRPWPASSRRDPTAPHTQPGTRPIVFDTFAVTGPYPNASSTGKVIRVPLPTRVLIAPAATPARAIETTSPALIYSGAGGAGIGARS